MTNRIEDSQRRAAEFNANEELLAAQKRISELESQLKALSIVYHALPEDMRYELSKGRMERFYSAPTKVDEQIEGER